MTSFGPSVYPPVRNEGNWVEYAWIVVLGALFSGFMACAIGANDVANSFGTTVGSRTLTLMQACCVAAVFEFTGALALGTPIADSVVFAIVEKSEFVYRPEALAYGMMCSLAAAGSWVAIATMMELAVSTTHSIVGALVGVALVWGGGSAVVWAEPSDEFPFYEGVVPILLSWITSPLISGVISAALFACIRNLVLRREQSTSLAMTAAPLLILVTLFVGAFLVLYKGAEGDLDWGPGKAAWVSGVASVGLTVLLSTIGWLVLHDRLHLPIRLKKWLGLLQEEQAPEVVAGDSGPIIMTMDQAGEEDRIEAEARKGKDGGIRVDGVVSWGLGVATMGLRQDIFDEYENDPANVVMREGFEKGEDFSMSTEHVFKYLQVFSACCVSFAHGANDVGNAVAPFGVIWYVYCNWSIVGDLDVPYWILAMGGAGIVIGLATFGYKVMKSLGVFMIKMSPVRGFCAELSTAFTVSMCSAVGLPVSTTQCIVGAEVGIGLCENLRTGLNWKLLLKTVTAWVSTVLIAGLISSALFSFGIFAPGRTSEDNKYELYLKTILDDNIRMVNASNYGDPVSALNLSTPYVNASLDYDCQNLTYNTNYQFNASEMGRIQPDPLMYNVNESTLLLRDHSAAAVAYQVESGQYGADNATYPH